MEGREIDRRGLIEVNWRLDAAASCSHTSSPWPVESLRKGRNTWEWRTLFDVSPGNLENGRLCGRLWTQSLERAPVIVATLSLKSLVNEVSPLALPPISPLSEDAANHAERNHDSHQSDTQQHHNERLVGYAIYDVLLIMVLAVTSLVCRPGASILLAVTNWHRHQPSVVDVASESESRVGHEKEAKGNEGKSLHILGHC